MLLITRTGIKFLYTSHQIIREKKRNSFPGTVSQKDIRFTGMARGSESMRSLESAASAARSDLVPT